MKNYFTFLDRYYVKSQEALRPLIPTGFEIYYETVFKQFKNEIPGVLLKLIASEREGHEVERPMIKLAIGSFIEVGKQITPPRRDESEQLQVYQDLFETKFLEETRQWYELKSRQWLTSDTPEYLAEAEKRINDEEGRQRSYLDMSTQDKLRQVIYKELLMQHQNELLNKPTGLRKMFERMHGMTMRQASSDLARLFKLYKLKGDEGIKPIAEIMRRYISDQGQQFVDGAKKADGAKGSETARQKQLIEHILNLHALFLGIVTHQFEGHIICDRALRDGFKDFVNQEEYVAIRLAQFSHSVLKKGGERGNQDINTLLDNITRIYDYINDKDYFEANYQRFLAERLISDLSESFESEKNMIAKLKTVGGNAAWSKRLEDMFKDLTTSWDNMNDFKQHLAKNPVKNPEQPNNPVEFDCRVCTYGAWPSANFDIVPMPTAVKPMTDLFKKFYEDKFSGRTLEYRMDQGKAEIVIPFKAGTKTFVVSPFQMSVLLKFNEKGMWDYKSLQAATGIPEQTEDMERAMLSLIHPKLKLLQKKPSNKRCEAGDLFRLNSKFKQQRTRIVVTPWKQSVKKQQAQSEQEKRAVIRLREHQIDASIVRVMKTRKEAKHNELIREVVAQLSSRFSPAAAFIKKRIAGLIEQDYLKRDESDRTRYIYIS